MKVTLFDYTGADTPNPSRYAAAMLLFTKNTRLKMNPTTLIDLTYKTDKEINQELQAMSRTNPGSWEFIHLSFLIEGASRSLQQQVTRTRQASYAIQSLRVVDASDLDYETGPSIKNDLNIKGSYRNTVANAFQCYKFLIDAGAKMEDARDVLPLATHSNICMSINMRNFINMARKRSSKRVQDIHINMIDLMRIEVEKVYPWFYMFYGSNEMRAYNELFEIIQDNKKLTYDEKTEMYRRLDIIKGEL